MPVSGWGVPRLLGHISHQRLDLCAKPLDLLIQSNLVRLSAELRLSER
jgi:hypothetical protein